MGWTDKYKKSIDCNNPKGFSQRAHCQGKKKKMEEESNPRIPRKKGQPANSKKHSDLYTDENPKGTIHGLGFKDVATAKASVAKIKKSSRSHAHKIQAAVAMEQRAREMGKTSEAAVYRKFINMMKKKTKEMNEEMKKCPQGQYYCFTDKKCKKIPTGYRIGGEGMLEPEGEGNGDGGGMGESLVHEGGSLHNWFKGSKSKDGKGGWVQSDGSPCANEPGETKTPKCYSSKRLAALKRKGKKGENIIKSADRRKREQDRGQQSKTGAAKPTYVKTFAKGKKDKNYVKPEPGLKEMTTQIDEASKDIKGKGSGKKDACYYKVKANSKVWPSAYASGRLVQCRKKGAANWGNKTEETEINTITFQQFQEKCWKGYEKKGMKTMFGKRYPNCVKKEEFEKEVPSGDIKKLVKKAVKRVDNNVSGHVDKNDKTMGNYGEFVPSADGKGKVVTSVKREEFSNWRDGYKPTEYEFINVIEDWQKVNKSDKTDGMSKKAVAAYRRENPGSKLKTAVTGDPKPGSKDAKRRKSFCARSKGQQDMHNIDCSKTPDKPVCKARRRWKC